MPTEKRAKYLAKLAKKEEAQRTRDDRLAEVDKIRGELQRLGLTTELSEIAKFHEILDDFLENGTGFQGIIGIKGTGRELCYQLLNNKKHDIGVMLRANPDMK